MNAHHTPRHSHVVYAQLFFGVLIVLSAFYGLRYSAFAQDSGSSTTTVNIDTTAPTPPVLQGRLDTSGVVMLYWTASSDNVGVTRYRVYRDGGKIAELPMYPYYDSSNLTPGVTLHYTVTAVDAAGNESAPSNVILIQIPSNETPDTIPPSTPVLEGAYSATDKTVHLYWSASTDNIGVTGYKIKRNGVLVSQSTALAYVDSSNITEGTTLNYVVVAFDAAGNLSLLSNTVSITVPLTPSSSGSTTTTTTSTATDLPPATPSLVVTNVATGKVGLSFSSVDDVGITGYRILRNNSFLGAVSGSTHDYVDTTGVPGTTYSYIVVAIDTANHISPQSEPVQATFPVDATTQSTSTSPVSIHAVASVTPMQLPECTDGVPKTPVYLALSHVDAGIFNVSSSNGVSREGLIPGKYIFPNGSYQWKAFPRIGYTLDGFTSGSFTLSGVCAPSTTATTSTTDTAPQPTPSTSLQTKITTPTVTNTTLVQKTVEPSLRTVEPEPLPPVSDPARVSSVTETLSPQTCTSETGCALYCNSGKSTERECVEFARSRIEIPRVSDEGDSATSTQEVRDDASHSEGILENRIGVRSFIDTDRDGVTDYDEVNIYHTDPVQPDTDHDGTTDGNELLARTDPTTPPVVVSEGETASTTSSSTVSTSVSEDKNLLLRDVLTPGPRVSDEFLVRDIVVTETGTTSEGFLTATKLVFNGKALPNSFVTLYIFSDPVVVTVKTDESGLWTYTLDTELPDGSHQVVAALTDTGGRVLAQSTPLPFVKEAAAVSVGSAVLVGGVSEAPGFFSGLSLYVVIGLIAFLFVLALGIIGIVVSRREPIPGGVGSQSHDHENLFP